MSPFRFTNRDVHVDISDHAIMYIPRMNAPI